MAPAGASGSSSKTDNRSKKRKLAPAAPAPTESRFTFATEDMDDAPPPAQLSDAEDGDADEGDDEELGDILAGPLTTSLPAHLLPSSGKAHGTPGLIYLSRIPPGMGPSKVKHLLSAYGETGRVFLARSDPTPPQDLKSRKRQKDKHREHRFAEGWVEFMDKKVARKVAELMNANTIGGKKGSRWRDDVWTMKYLPRFRWDMLSEQVALERATQTSLLRFHLQHSRTEQESYLSAVEKARVNTAIKEKAEGRAASKVASGEVTVEKAAKKERKREYRQREVVDAPSGTSAKTGRGTGDLAGVLSRLF